MSRFVPLRLASVLLAVAGSLVAAGCGDDGISPSNCPPLDVRWSHPDVAVTPGASRTVHVSLGKDATCAPAQIVVSSSEPGVAHFDSVVVVPEGASRATVEITGEAPGQTTLTATWRLTGGDRSDTIDVFVSDGTLASCDGDASGTVSPGDSVEVTGGGLAGSSAALPEGAARDDAYHVDPFDVQIGCGDDQVPDGYTALGPAVTFGPEALRFDREIPLRIPVNAALLPDGAHAGHIEVSYTGPGLDTPRIVPAASARVQGAPDRGQLAFASRRLGTFQAVTRAEGPSARMRDFTFQGITGVSMGAGGAGLIGLHNPDDFDLVAPLGGPVDWIYLLDYIRTYHLGGFCSEEERGTAPGACEAGADVSRTPPSDQLHEHRQDFEHWWYVDEYGGQGGTFDRHEYIQIFRDLTLMYGNANTTRAVDALTGEPDMTEPNVLPPGISEDWLASADPCATPVDPDFVIDGCLQGEPCNPYFDDEYNPDGDYDVIPFCDGAEVVVDGARDVGVWDPEGNNDYPTVLLAAVDIDGNGQRDPGEPVIRAGREPFEDCGLDGLCNPDEPGYDPATNPDPNGDDYDFQFNPNGTEGNRLRDSMDGDPCNPMGEAFSDVGLDGVKDTAQISNDGFDYGEGNDCWDLAQGAERMFGLNPRTMAREMDLDALRDVDVWSDGGIRDLFNFGVVHDHFAGAFAARGQNLRLYNGHGSLTTKEDERFDPAKVNWGEVGKYVQVRYGDPDASEALKEAGDGGHVGTADQLIHRVLSALYWMNARWPDGDRDITEERSCAECEDSFTFEFESSLGRTGPVGVVLPPGYHNPDNEDRSYPIVYLLHGYGQEPGDLVDIGFILRDRMNNPAFPTHARLQKMIIVFPDGKCRGDECIQGTFYTDPHEGRVSSPLMETWVLELAQHMRDAYRVKAPATIEVTE